MVARFHLWWQQIKQNRITIQFVAIFLVVAIILILIGYHFDWTGFNVYTVTVKSNATGGTTLPTNITVYLPSKTLYDWLQLLFIPAILTLGAVWLTSRQNHDSEIAKDTHQQVALQDYIDKMSELLLEKHLRQSKPDDEVRNIARVRTMAVLVQLNPERKRILVRFLQESGLIYKDNTIINLNFAALYMAELYNASLEKVSLRQSDLRMANLNNADLSDADLSDANLSDANLSDADLS